MIIWDEVEYGKKIYGDSSVKTKKYQYKELKCLIKYLLSEDKKLKEIRESLDSCCDDNIKYLTDKQKRNIFDKLINQCKIKKTKSTTDDVEQSGVLDNPYINKITVTIYKSEIEKIKQVNNGNLERILFVLLVYKKWLGNLEWVSIVKSDLFKECGLSNINSKQQQVLLHMLFETNMVKSDVIRLNRKQYHRGNEIKKQMWKLDFSECNSEEVVFSFDNYTNFIFRYLRYCGSDEYYECRKCGGMFKQNKNRTRQFCNDCSEYQPIGVKVLKCVGCGKEFEVDGIVKNKNRCDECQKNKQKEYERIKKQNQRNKY